MTLAIDSGLAPTALTPSPDLVGALSWLPGGARLALDPAARAAIAFHRLALAIPGPYDHDADLAALCADRRARILRALVMLARVIADLRRMGIEALVLKGPALAHQVHGSALARAFNDLDLLIQPRDLAGARLVLQGLGYRDVTPPPRRHDEIYRGRAGDPIIELHVRLAPDDALLPMARFDPWGDAVDIDLPGVRIKTLAAHKTLVYAAWHGHRHHWRRLFWLYDLARAAARVDLPWARAGRFAQDLGLERILGLGLIQGQRVFNAPWPDGLQLPPKAIGLARQASAAYDPVWTQGQSDFDHQAVARIGLVPHVLWSLRLRPDGPARLAFLRALITPSMADRDMAGRIGWPGALGVRAWRAARRIRHPRERRGRP